MDRNLFKKFSEQVRDLSQKGFSTFPTGDRSYFGHVLIVVGVLAVAIFAGIRQAPEDAGATARIIVNAEATAFQPSAILSESGEEAEEGLEIEPAVKSIVEGQGSDALADPTIQAAPTITTDPVVDADAPLVINPAAALVRDLDAQNSAFLHAGSASWPLASLTKLMTALVALEELGGDASVVISASAVATEGVAGSFSVGQEYLVKDLVAAMMTSSSNDAAVALQEAYDAKQARSLNSAPATGTSPFILSMRAKANVLGMNDTFFDDPSGLSAVNQSTVLDVERLARAILKTQPDIFNLSRQSEVTITNQLTGAKRTIRSINRFAGRSDFLGGKTGYTDHAGENLLSLFKHGEKTYLIVVFGSQDRFGETLKLLSWTKAQ
ncbi:MAG: hypothetical protein COU11_00785 [Candidatus Harrisonbacteria bacterium CG10_big_fil_rev_8_21_14_0_10_49_15]|uniref:Peptidase S11 D-alanyl-D-alanine carboxypeptidase A N-terminal domain-containing protein n=1 Tax=Candidatus Harrisonbacteria bacterium CG10_big_fil_rev_8_21_14_0_10_49_15 TaxID=1974587 RepID=A0A2H0ULT9_9BACT|nr:MAG: hypothetical protein COU11_00785 [Candidatus Harrisonbacteria bacterium CG10_big_fil_rev_8_21_14_0_10_49_15]